MLAISVIIVNWNGRHYLETCLSSLRRQTFRDFEAILVDNGSTDGSVEFVQGRFPEVRVISLPSNLGFAAANGVGYQQARGELIVLLNNDTEVHPGWLEALRQASCGYPRAGSFACKMVLFDDRKRLDNCGHLMTPSCSTIDIGREQEDGPDYSQVREVFGGCGGAVAYRRSMLEDIGFFDTDFFMTYEDADLSFRGQLRGYSCVFVPTAIVYHRCRATMANFPKRQVFFSQRSIEFVYIKNMPLALMLRFAPQRFLYEIGSAIYFFRGGAGFAFLKAKASALRHLPLMLKKRRTIQKRRTISNALLRSKLADGWFNAKLRKFFANRHTLPFELQRAGGANRQRIE